MIMSKHFRATATAGLSALVLTFAAAMTGRAQVVEANIRLLPDATAIVDGRFVGGGEIRNLSFVSHFAGALDLAERIEGLSLSSVDGERVTFTKFQPGEYIAASSFDRWSYHIRLKAPRPPAAAAHVSWVGDGSGLLFLNDLLPALPASAGEVMAKIRLELPAGWTAVPSAGREVAGGVEFRDARDGVILVGRDLRVIVRTFDSIRAKIAVAGAWQFSNEELSNAVSEIYSSYRAIFDAEPADDIRVFVSKFPTPTQPGNWTADARGSAVTIVSSDMPFKAQSVQRLHEQLRHEMFHLWLPNAVKLSGNYDWFYEGFALYHSLKTGVALNRIRFEDLLDTLARAHGIDTLQTQRPTLIEASRLRANVVSNTQVYARGMLVAFLCDLAVLNKSKGKESIETFTRSVFRTYRNVSPPRDGNDAVLELMRRRPDLVPIVERYINGRDEIGWQSDLLAAGIESTRNNYVTTLKVKEKPNGRQKAILDKLGYNSWRRLPANSR